MIVRPSSLVMLAECPKFESAPSEAATAGLVRHQALAAYLQGNQSAFEEMKITVPTPPRRSEQKAHENIAEYVNNPSEESVSTQTVDGVENLIWAADYIKLKAPLQDFPLVVETKKQTVLPIGMPISGTPDFVCGSHIFDLKWRYRDYTPQMACYALMLISDGNFNSVTCHVLYAQPQTIQTLQFDAGTAWQVIKPIITKLNEPFAAPTPCEYCGWCAKKQTCEALIQQVNIALASNPEWNLPQWHSSKIESADEMGLALKIARTLAKWCESVEHHAKEMAIKKGIVASDFELFSRKGNRYISDVIEAFQKAGLPQEEFLKTCSVRPRVLFDLYATFHGMSRYAAEKEVQRKLGSTIQRYDTVTFLQAKKTKKEE